MTKGEYEDLTPRQRKLFDKLHRTIQEGLNTRLSEDYNLNKLHRIMAQYHMSRVNPSDN